MHRPAVTIIGERFQSGTYLLRIGVKEPLRLVFGRFIDGRAVAVPRGTYLYLGSAMGRRGPSSLARRLVRHSTRSQGRAPHAIQQILILRFWQVGLGPQSLRGPLKKTPFWHIDYLLDETAVALEAVLAVRSGNRLEAALASWLVNHRWTSLLHAGLGAADAPGETHLVRLHGDDVSWDALLHEVFEFLTVTTNEAYLEESWDD